jgi:hypothetical protein
MNAQTGDAGGDAAASLSAVDRLVLATVNAPYSRSITADVLSECLANAELGGWAAHVANFFTDVSPDLVFAFAEFHGIPACNLAQAYAAMKSTTGECNRELESALASMAPAA